MEREDFIRERIFVVRGVAVMIDSDLARIYGVLTKNLNKAVKRNIERFPEDFMFQLTQEEWDGLKGRFRNLDDESLRFQIGTSNSENDIKMLPAKDFSRFQNGTSKRGGVRYLPYAFTQEGVMMLSSVLRSKVASDVNVEVMRAFVAMRRLLPQVLSPKTVEDIYSRIRSLEAAVTGNREAVNGLRGELKRIYALLDKMANHPALLPPAPVGYQATLERQKKEDDGDNNEKE